MVQADRFCGWHYENALIASLLSSIMEFVAYSSDSGDKGLAFGLDFCTNAADMDVHRPGASDIINAPNKVQKLVAVKNPPGVLH